MTLPSVAAKGVQSAVVAHPRIGIGLDHRTGRESTVGERCPSCREYLRSYQTTLELERLFLIGTDDPVHDAPEELVTSILARLR